MLKDSRAAWRYEFTTAPDVDNRGNVLEYGPA
jgi:hypothetical protein